MATAPTSTKTGTTTADNQSAGASGDAIKTEQEKAGKVPPGKLVRLGSTEATPAPGMGEPYPEGSPPDPEVLFEQIHGFKKSDL